MILRYLVSFYSRLEDRPELRVWKYPRSMLKITEGTKIFTIVCKLLISFVNSSFKCSALSFGKAVRYVGMRGVPQVLHLPNSSPKIINPTHPTPIPIHRGVANLTYFVRGFQSLIDKDKTTNTTRLVNNISV